jgi:hypothetical protein
MGMSQVVPCPSGVPDWPQVAEWLASHSSPAQMRMIDGQLAFPEEEPPAEWHELRVALAGGMVTIRRQEGAVELVTWGNADDAMRQAWDTIARAFEQIGRRPPD